MLTLESQYIVGLSQPFLLTLPVNRLALCMIVADESETLQKCLESVAPFVDTIYLTSTQDFPAVRLIAERFHAKLRSFPWVNDFSAARNFSISDVAEEWILCLDADDVFPRGEAAKIRAHLGPHATAYSLQYQIGDELTPAAGLKIFRNHRGIRYEGIIHEHLRHSLNRLPGTPVGHLPIHLIHTGYADELLPQKALRNIPLLRRELQRCLRVGDAHQLLYVGNSLATSLQRTNQPRRAETLLRWLIQRLHKFETVFSSDWEIAILSNYLAARAAIRAPTRRSATRPPPTTTTRRPLRRNPNGSKGSGRSEVIIACP